MHGGQSAPTPGFAAGQEGAGHGRMPGGLGVLRGEVLCVHLCNICKVTNVKNDRQPGGCVLGGRGVFPEGDLGSPG